MDPAIQVFAAAVGMTVSLVAAFGGLAAWFVRRLDRRFDAIDRRFDGIDKRFDAVDRRFVSVEGRFDAVDRRFVSVEGRFDAVDRRFVSVEGRFDAVDRRFDAIDRRFDAVDARFDALHEDIREQMAVAREERARLSNRLDAQGQRVDGLANQLSDVRHSLGRLEGVMLRTFEPEELATPQQR